MAIIKRVSWLWVCSVVCLGFAGIVGALSSSGAAWAADAVAGGADVDFFGDVVHVIQKWTTIGWLAGIAILAGAGVKLIASWPPARSWLDARGLLPQVAGGLGALAGALGALAAKQSDQILTAAASGYMAGLAMVGLNQTAKQLGRAKTERAEAARGGMSTSDPPLAPLPPGVKPPPA